MPDSPRLRARGNAAGPIAVGPSLRLSVVFSDSCEREDLFLEDFCLIEAAATGGPRYSPRSYVTCRRR